MSQPSHLHVQGRITRIEPEPGGAATVRIEIDEHQDRGAGVSKLQKPLSLHFFYPNYSPESVSVGNRVWVWFELYSSRESISFAGKRRFEITSLNSLDKYEYSLAGELFLWPKSSSSPLVYVDSGIPMLLTAGRNMTDVARSGSPVHISKGRIYGEVERSGPEQNQARPS